MSDENNETTELTQTATTIRIVPLLEITDSMQVLGYFAAAKAAVSAFIAAVGPEAQFAVVAYGNEAKPIYPKRGLTAWDATTVDEATSLVMTTMADAELVNWSAAIERGAKALGKRGSRSGMLFLLADGIWNTGTDPLLDLPDGVVIYTFALGLNGQAEALREIATKTGGTFTQITEATTIGTVLLNSLEEIGAGTILVNSVRDVSPARPLSIPPTVQPNTVSMRVVLSWSNPEVLYAPVEGPHHLTLSILDPSFQPYQATQLFTSAGYAVFDVENPQAGSWYLKITYGGPDAVTVNLAAIATTAAAAPTET